MENIKGDTYTLSMSYDPKKIYTAQAEKGVIDLITTDATAKLVKAVSRNIGGTPKFVYGPWQSGYSLETYGIDTGTNTVWVVINYNGNFVVASEK
jgi:hypothetical protein